MTATSKVQLDSMNNGIWYKSLVENIPIFSLVGYPKALMVIAFYHTKGQINPPQTKLLLCATKGGLYYLNNLYECMTYNTILLYTLLVEKVVLDSQASS